MKKVKSFTLIELLIVMGILVILIGTAIITARYAIQRSQKIFHMAAAEELEQALLSYKNENKYVPRMGSCSSCVVEEFFAYSLGYKGTNAMLLEYIEETPFDGGSDATYYYATDDIGQFFVVCVSLGGIDDENQLGYYCTGTGIGFVPEGNPITKQELGPDAATIINTMDDSDWEKDTGFARTSM
ncbi:MAG: type II secretion system protein [Candidatus Dojkabacteria bacterium]|nr:type II secretion system protein [Candidatus Dojkabacteria bacterium]